MDVTRSRFFGKLVLLLALTLPLMAQSADVRQVAPEIPGWAHPPIVVLPTPSIAPNVSGLSPSKMRVAYGLNNLANKGAGQVIALVDAYDNPNAETDLGVFTTQFGLPACTTANGCFKKIYAAGTKPPTNAGWAGESSLDIEWAYAIAQQAKIILVEASSNSNNALWQAVDVAVQNGATVVSMSFGGSEYSGEVTADTHFNVPGVTFCASSGDSGHQAQYPAASPFVVSVGGTTLTVGANGAWTAETAWSGSGGGSSTYETQPSYQAGYQTTGKRGIPDVALDADPNSGVAVYSKTGFRGWAQVGGTSLSAPVWAAIIAIANSSRIAAGKTALTLPQTLLYPAAEANYHDIVSGSNGSCGAQCTAVAGYDFITGVGSPRGAKLVQALVAAP
ncbi:MAG: S53 family peptidase [Bryobacteraceae bacterium]